MAASAYEQTAASSQDVLYGPGPRPGMGLRSEMSKGDNEEFLNLTVPKPGRPPQTDVDFWDLGLYPGGVVALAPLPTAEFFLPSDSKRLPVSKRTTLRALSPEEKMAFELRAFEAMEPQLVAQHDGCFVAIHNGQVLDSDDNHFRLAARIEERAMLEGPIAICRVLARPLEPQKVCPYGDIGTPFPAESEP